METKKLERTDYTVEEYLAMVAEEGEHRLEYYDGHIEMMAGGTPVHAQVIGNVYGELYTRLKGSDCKPLTADQGIHISKGKYLLPDISVVCGEKKFEKQGLFLTNPILLIEVLSKSTELKDRDLKFKLYRQIPTFQEYVLIDSKKLQVDSFFRATNGQWTIQNYYSLDQKLRLHALDLEIPLLDIYADTNLVEEER